MADDEFLTTEEVLDYLQVNLADRLSPRSRPARSRPVRVGRQWRFRKRDIDAWLTANRRILRHAGRDGEVTERPRVLVVDDEESVRDLVAKTLEAEYDVDTVADGPAAVDRLRAADYDLLITDLKMPGMDGLSVIREVRRQRPSCRSSSSPGYSTEASAIEAINLGVTGYLTKPFRLDRI